MLIFRLKYLIEKGFKTWHVNISFRQKEEESKREQGEGEGDDKRQGEHRQCERLGSKGGVEGQNTKSDCCENRADEVEANQVDFAHILGNNTTLNGRYTKRLVQSELIWFVQLRYRPNAFVQKL